MALQLANRAGALRRLHLGDIPSRVFTVQNQLRQLSLSSQPRLITPKAGVLSTTISQNATFATQATKPKKPKTTTKATKKPKTTKTTKKRELTDKQKEAKALREERDLKKKLKETALTTPKKLPATAYQLAIQSTMAEARAASGGAKQTEAFQKAVQLTKAIPSYEMSRFENQAEENRIANEAAYADWLKAHTPAQIRDANVARRRLAAILNKPCVLLKDDRLVKRPRSTFMYFSGDRRDSGDFKHMTIGETSLRIADEWKNLTESEKEPYEKRAAEDRARYAREHEEAYGEPPKSFKSE